MEVGGDAAGPPAEGNNLRDASAPVRGLFSWLPESRKDSSDSVHRIPASRRMFMRQGRREEEDAQQQAAAGIDEAAENPPAPCIHREHPQPCTECLPAPAENLFTAYELSGDPGNDAPGLGPGTLSCHLTALLSVVPGAGRKNGAKRLFSDIKKTSQWQDLQSRHQAVRLNEAAQPACVSRRHQ